MENKNKIIIATVVIIAIVMGAWWYFGKDKVEPAEGEPIKIGAVMPLTGAASIYDELQRQAVELAVEEINLDGGIDGQKLEVIYEDSASEPKIGIQAVNKLLAQNVQIIIGDLVSGISLSIAPVVKDKDVVMIVPGAASPKLTGVADNVFRTKVAADVEAKEASQYLKKQYLGSKVAFIYQNSDYGVGVHDALKPDLESDGTEVVASESYVINSTDFRSLLTKIKATKPDIIIMTGYQRELGLILKQAKEQEITAQFFAHSGSVGPDIYEVAGSDSNGLKFLYEVNPLDGNNLAKDFIQSYRLKYNTEPELFSMLGYDTIYVIKDVLDKCSQSQDTSCVKNLLHDNYRYQGITGPITFDDQGSIVRNRFNLFELQDGKIITAND